MIPIEITLPLAVVGSYIFFSIRTGNKDYTGPKPKRGRKQRPSLKEASLFVAMTHQEDPEKPRHGYHKSSYRSPGSTDNGGTVGTPSDGLDLNFDDFL